MHMGLPTFILVLLNAFPPRRRTTPLDLEKASGAQEVAGDAGEDAAAEDVEDAEDAEDAEEDVFSEDLEDDEADTGTRRFRRFHSLAESTASSTVRPPRGSLSLKVSRTNTTDTAVSKVSMFTKVKEFIFPPEDPTALERSVPNYRWTPIISGVVIPFSILLEIPGLTERWYIRTENNETVETKPNPALLDAAMAVSIAFALVANVCLVLRFLEKRVRTTTLLCILFLTLHGVFNFSALGAMSDSPFRYH